MMMGMWTSMREMPEFDDFIKVDKCYGERFLAIKSAVLNLMKQEKINSLVPNLLIDSISESTEPDKKAKYVSLVDDLREISLTAIGIMARLEQMQVASQILEVARQLFNFEENTWTHGVLDLLNASSQIHMARLGQGNFDDMAVFDEKKQSAFKIFHKIDDTEGMADVYFCWAIRMILDPKYAKAKDGGDHDSRFS